VLVLITDGEDRSSFTKKEELFKLLRKEDVQIFVIGLVNELDKESGLIRKSPREKAVGLLEEMAKETGGHLFFARSLSDLEPIATEIARALHTQYVIGYSLTNPPGKDKISGLKARVKLSGAPGRGKLKAIVRPISP
jgi:VWFA-related protein